MKKVEFSEFGDERVLQVVDRSQPEVGPNDVLVAVKAASVNPGEAGIREGHLEAMFPTTFPCGEGADFAGDIVQVGTNVTDYAIGDMVAGYTETRASHAELVVAPTKNIVPKPEAVSYEVAGSLYVAGVTAIACMEAVNVQPGDVVVVAGASGAVGLLAAQLAVVRGAKVIGIASANYHDWLEAHNITPIEYHDNIKQNIEAVTDHVDAFIDTVGKGYIDVAVSLGVAPERINTVIDFETAQKVGTKAEGAMAVDGANGLATLLELLAADTITLPIAKTFPLDDVQDAYRYQATKHDIGKVVLLPA